MSTEKSYRPDIDGLRTLAVLPVLLFHAGFLSIAGIPVAPGGYVGVDVFFVISGYLISKIIHAEISSDNWSVATFYARRVRRIFPALFVVYAACLIWAAGFGLAGDAQAIQSAVISSILFVSNLNFANQSGYFDTGLQNNPLLHTWSLSIEEQFYILFPLILIALRHASRKALLAALCVLVLASFAASVFLSLTRPDSAYYSLSARAWELGIGSLLAVWAPHHLSRRLAEVLGIAGLAAIFYAIVSFDKATTFPGPWALVPVLGAAAVILSGSVEKTTVSRLLGLSALRGIGLISYSLYLWHWPVLVILRLSGYGDRVSALAGIGLSFLLAFLSWKFIETPFRRAGTGHSSISVVRGGVFAMAAMAGAAVLTPIANAHLRPMAEDLKRLAAFDGMADKASMREGTCFLTTRTGGFEAFDPETCLTKDPSRQNILLIGDSHAAQYYEALRLTQPQAHILQATASGCLPIHEGSGDRRCRDLWTYLTEDFLPGQHFDAIIMAGRWKQGSEVAAFATAKDLSSHADQVLVIGSNPEFPLSLPRMLASHSPDANFLGMDEKQSALPRKVDQDFQKAAPEESKVTYLSYFETLCSEACPLFSSMGEPTLYDENHLTVSAAMDFLLALGTLEDTQMGKTTDFAQQKVSQ